MSNAPNDLAEDFPDKGDRIHQLKTSNNRFARLFDEYNELNRTIHRIETRVEPTTEEVEEELKRRRLQLKDEIMAMLDGRGRLIAPHIPRWPRATARASAAETCASERRKLSASGVVTLTVTETGRPPRPPRTPSRPSGPRASGITASAPCSPMRPSPRPSGK